METSKGPKKIFSDDDDGDDDDDDAADDKLAVLPISGDDDDMVRKSSGGGGGGGSDISDDARVIASAGNRGARRTAAVEYVAGLVVKYVRQEQRDRGEHNAVAMGVVLLVVVASSWQARCIAF